VQLKAVQFLALVLTALALVPGGAHLFALANKISLAQLYGRGTPFALALFAFLCLAFTLVIFFVWTFPANQSTGNWTTVPANWEELRRQWEYSHAANALVTLAAFCSVALSVLNTRE
jgi:hypothetical protein